MKNILLLLLVTSYAFAESQKIIIIPPIQEIDKSKEIIIDESNDNQVSQLTNNKFIYQNTICNDKDSFICNLLGKFDKEYDEAPKWDTNWQTFDEYFLEVKEYYKNKNIEYVDIRIPINIYRHSTPSASCRREALQLSHNPEYNNLIPFNEEIPSISNAWFCYDIISDSFSLQTRSNTFFNPLVDAYKKNHLPITNPYGIYAEDIFGLFRCTKDKGIVGRCFYGLESFFQTKHPLNEKLKEYYRTIPSYLLLRSKNIISGCDIGKYTTINYNEIGDCIYPYKLEKNGVDFLTLTELSSRFETSYSYIKGQKKTKNRLRLISTFNINVIGRHVNDNIDEVVIPFSRNEVRSNLGSFKAYMLITIPITKFNILNEHEKGRDGNRLDITLDAFYKGIEFYAKNELIYCSYCGKLSISEMNKPFNRMPNKNYSSFPEHKERFISWDRFVIPERAWERGTNGYIAGIGTINKNGLVEGVEIIDGFCIANYSSGDNEPIYCNAFNGAWKTAMSSMKFEPLIKNNEPVEVKNFIFGTEIRFEEVE